MKYPDVIQFIIEPDISGGYCAHAVGFSIHTQGDTMDETIANIREAVACHFEEDGQVSPYIPILANMKISEKIF